MRIERVVKRINLKKRALATRAILHKEQRLRESAHRLYQAGVMDERMSLHKEPQ